jgi:uncharacterized protein YbjT (DUF2867 family)
VITRRAAIPWTLALLSALCGILSSSMGRADERRPPLVIIGATAQSAAALIPLAIKNGHKVIAVARQPDAVSFKDKSLTVVKGDVYDRASLEAVLTGTEIVIGVFGPRIDPSREVAKMDLFTTGYTNVIAAMKAKGNARLIVTSSIGAQMQSPRPPAPDASRSERWVWQLRGVYEDMRQMESLVRDSGLEYTILRPAQLMPEPERNDLKIAVDRTAPELTLITYADFARFILTQVVAGQFVGHTVALFSDRKLKYGANFLTEQ